MKDETLIRFECWDDQGWRGSGRLELPDQTPAELTGEAVRRLHLCGLLKTGGRFRLWVPGAEGWHAEGDISDRELALAAKIHDQS